MAALAETQLRPGGDYCSIQTGSRGECLANEKPAYQLNLPSVNDSVYTPFHLEISSYYKNRIFSALSLLILTKQYSFTIKVEVPIQLISKTFADLTPSKLMLIYQTKYTCSNTIYD